MMKEKELVAIVFHSHYEISKIICDSIGPQKQIKISSRTFPTSAVL